MHVSMITHSRRGPQAFQDLRDPALHDKNNVKNKKRNF